MNSQIKRIKNNGWPQGSTKFTAFLIFFLAATFYLYEYILQVAPSVMAQPMMQTFQVTAEGFGIISAFYFYSYAPMQLPAGVLFDRYGPRKLMTIALVLCAIGSFFFAATDTIIAAAFGRFIIGVASAFSFIGVLVLISRWFPAHYFAILAGLAQAMSSIGAICGEMPLATLIEHVGWRNASFILAIIGVFLAILLWVFIRDYPHQQIQSVPQYKFREEWQRLREVCKHSYTWFTGLYAFCIWTPIAVFAALWGVAYLQTRFGISLVKASGMCSMIWLGIAIGSPVLGWISDILQSRRIALYLSALLGLSASLILLYLSSLTVAWAYLILFVLGLGAGGQTVSFAVIRDNNPLHLVGTASGFNNLSVLLGAAIFQPIVGIILHKSANTIFADGSYLYTVASYQSALIIMPICYLISLLVSFLLLKESHPDSTKIAKISLVVANLFRFETTK